VLINGKIKRIVRAFFRRVFDIDHDRELLDHESASRQEVRAFIEEGGPGPDPNALRFDMYGTYNNPWNMSVIQILTKALRATRQSRPQHERWEERPDSYINRLFQEKFKRCRTIWNRSRAQVTDDGVRETPHQVQQRLQDDDITTHKAQRHLSRRIKVCWFLLLHFCQATLISIASRGMTDESACWVPKS
jgi:hypothetical protein